MRNSALLAVAVLLLGGCSWFSPNDESTRTVGTVIDDETVEVTVLRTIHAANPALRDAHINVNSYGGVVLLTGQIGSENEKQIAEQAIKGLRKVDRVHNELEIAGPASFLARQNDTWLTAKVKAQLVADERVNAEHFKVITENNAVFLMGRVTRAESTRAVEIASNVFGVQRVVTVFELID